jgi:uncharacterized protein (DUF983 family)
MEIIKFTRNVFTYKCPRCRKGKIFSEPFKMSDPVNMPDNCPVCGQKTMPEPGFYYGAMFASYIFSGFFFLALAGLGLIVFKWSLELTFVCIIGVFLLSYFKILRTSRSLWLNLMVRHDPNAIKSKKI